MVRSTFMPCILISFIASIIADNTEIASYDYIEMFEEHFGSEDKDIIEFFKIAKGEQMETQNVEKTSSYHYSQYSLNMLQFDEEEIQNLLKIPGAAEELIYSHTYSYWYPTPLPTETPSSYPTLSPTEVPSSRRPTRAPTDSGENIYPPALSSAKFSDDGMNIIILFDGPSDKARSKLLNFAGQFNCSWLFQFDGAISSLCIWTSDSSVTAALVYNPAGPNAYAGDLVFLRSDMLRRACYDPCSFDYHYLYSNLSSTPLLAPTNPVAPIVSLLVSGTLISSCDSITLDPTGSFGKSLRPWTKVQWTVSGNGNLTAIRKILASYSYDTASRIRINNDMLSVGSISFTLSLTTFLGQSASSTVTVDVSTNALIPSVSLSGPIYQSVSGPGVINMYRNSILKLGVSASLPSCASSSDQTLLYGWNIYLKESGAPAPFVSVSNNPRVFLLSAYSLDASTEYVVKASVTSFPADQSSFSEVIVSVGQYGVVANIDIENSQVGASAFTLYENSNFSLTAAASIDIDYPDSILEYLWDCVEIEPNSGNDCHPSFSNSTNSSFNDFLTNSTDLFFSNGFFATGVKRTLEFTLYVSRSYPVFSESSASIDVTLVTRAVPTIYIDPLSKKYNKDEDITITCYIESDYYVSAKWTGLDLDLNQLDSFGRAPAKTITERTFQKGKNLFFLTIRAFTFTEGVSYNFDISVGFVYTDINAVGAQRSITILINQAPSGGVLQIDPPEGDALITIFDFFTLSWSDDLSDYPITYTFGYHSGSSLIAFRSDGLSAAASSFLPAGLPESAFEVLCYVEARDIYQSSNSAAYPVIVDLLSLENSTDILDIVTNILDVVQATYDVSQVNAAVDVIISALQGYNMSKASASDCDTLNRYPASNSPQTCGSCLPGYEGFFGDANIACVQQESIFNRSRRLLVTVPTKECPANCNDNGKCIFVDYNWNSVSECLHSNPSCSAVCECNEGHTGKFCSVTSNNLETDISARYKICSAVNNTLSFADINAVLLQSTMISLTKLFSDLSLVDTSTIYLCSSVGFELIAKYPLLAASNEAFQSSLDFLSALIDNNGLYFDVVIEEVKKSLSKLCLGRESLDTVGSETFNALSNNIRLFCAIKYTSDYSSGVKKLKFYGEYSDNIADLFVFEQKSDVYDAVSSSDVAGIGYAQFLHYSAKNGSFSSTVQVQNAYYLVGRAPKISSSESPSQGSGSLSSGIIGRPSFNVRVDHLQSFNFSYSPEESVLAFCGIAPEQYSIEVKCSATNFSYFFKCSGMQEGYFNQTCPSVTEIPVCDASFRGSAFPQECYAVEFDSEKTICECKDVFVDNVNSTQRSLSTQDLISSGFQAITVTTSHIYSESIAPAFVHIYNFSENTFNFQGLAIGLAAGAFCCILCCFLVCCKRDNKKKVEPQSFPIIPEIPSEIPVVFSPPPISIVQIVPVGEPPIIEKPIEFLCAESSNDYRLARSFIILESGVFSRESRDIISSAMSANDISIINAGILNHVTAALIDEQYKTVIKYARHVTPQNIDLPSISRAKFKEVFDGLDWVEAIKMGVVLNASECCSYFKIGVGQLNNAWRECAKRGNMVKLSEDIFCCRVDNVAEGRVDAVYCINGFYEDFRNSQISKPLHYVEVEWDENRISWGKYLNLIIGNSGSDNYDSSVRHKLQEISVKPEDNVYHEYIHVSCSTFQCLAEKKLWLNISGDCDPFGRQLINEGMSLAHVDYLSSNVDYDDISVFHHVHGLTHREDLSMLFSLQHKPTDIPVFVKTYTGKTIGVLVKPTDSITRVKQIIQEQEGILVENQILLLSSRRLDDNLTVFDYEIKDDCILEMAIPIFVKALDGKIFNIVVEFSDTMSKIKQLMHDQEGIEILKLPLFYGGVELGDGQIVSDCNIQKDSMLHVGMHVLVKMLEEDIVISKGPSLKSRFRKASLSVMASISMKKSQLRDDLKEILTLKHIEFIKNESALTPEGVEIVDEVSAYLKKNPDITMNIESHTNCRVGTCTKKCINMELSQKRCETVRDRLVSDGCANQFKCKGWGCKDPVLGMVRLVRIFPEEDSDFSSNNTQKEPKPPSLVIVETEDEPIQPTKKWKSKIVTVAIAPAYSVASLKQRIEEIEEMPVAEQLLMLGGSRIEDERTLFDYNIQKDSIILMGMNIFVINKMSRELITLGVSWDPSDTIYVVKNLIQTKQGIPVERQRLSFVGTELDDSRTLAHYNIRRECTLKLETIDTKKQEADVLRRSRIIEVKEEIKQLLTAKDITFEKNESKLTSEGSTIVSEVAGFLRDRPEMTILIDGHTSCKSGMSKNNCDERCLLKDLSQERVEKVRDLLLSAGCRNVFIPKGWGCKHPKIGNVRMVRIYPESTDAENEDNDA